MSSKIKKEEACIVYIEKCLSSIHSGSNSSAAPTTATITSFFKIMAAPHCSNILYLPPKFGPLASTLVDKETIIEDMCWKQWRVRISQERGFYVIKNGWSRFVVEHGLEMGDLLVFSYLGGSRFHVSIYDKSACLKPNIIGNDKKRKRNGTGDDLVREDEPECALGKPFVAHFESEEGSVTNIGKCVVRSVRNSDNKMRKVQVPSLEKDFAEPFCMIDHDVNGCQEYGGKRIFNLFEFEVKNAFTDCKEKSPVTNTALPSVSKSMTIEAKAGLAEKDPATHRVPDASASAQTRKNAALEVKSVNKSSKLNSSKVDLPNSAVKVEKKDVEVSHYSPGGSPIISRRVTRLYKSQQMQKSLSAGRYGILENKPTPMIPKPSVFNGISQLKTEPGCLEQTRTLNMNIKEKLNVKVKTEALDPSFMSTPVVQFSCKATTKRQSFLELPVRLPSAACGDKTRARRVIYLQDSYMRLWSVFYHDKYNVKLLTSGWEAFSKASRIKPGDECTFKLKSEADGIYEVDIHRV